MWMFDPERQPSMSLAILILAAGQGKRMRSALPKVLHPLGGRPLLEHVVQTAQQLSPQWLRVVYGHGGKLVPNTLSHLPVAWVEQSEQLGTGHALGLALPGIPDTASALVLYGDVPLLTAQTLRRLIHAGGDGLALLSVVCEAPSGYGRIVRDFSGKVVRIVEENDATSEERKIREVNTGVVITGVGELRRWLGELDNRNAQGEFYLTDVVARAAAAGFEIRTVQPEDDNEVAGVNDRVQLAALERVYQASQARELMLAGVTLADPARLDVRGTVACAEDVTIDSNVVFEGEVRLGNRVRIGPNSVIRDAEIGDDVEIQANSVIERARIGAGSRIGPFARVRPETELAEGVHVGNFVEVKKSTIGAGSKINHLSYVGDSTIGVRVNIGAGTITCNYDGANKYRTVIGDDVFIGSGTQLVAPVQVGSGATVGAGSTITREVPAEKLTLSRARQVTVDGWKRPHKKSEGGGS
jgi:bifunctional UDP-N-acetylglucosamine pyrophosphorylase/glucosamine-1-phosphate N-acetyltransferase